MQVKKTNKALWSTTGIMVAVLVAVVFTTFFTAEAGEKISIPEFVIEREPPPPPPLKPIDHYRVIWEAEINTKKPVKIEEKPIERPKINFLKRAVSTIQIKQIYSNQLALISINGKRQFIKPNGGNNAIKANPNQKRKDEIVVQQFRLRVIKIMREKGTILLRNLGDGREIIIK